jgi:hypothetical protein
VSAHLQVVRVDATDAPVDRVGELLDRDRLRRLGWDPATGVFTVDPGDPTLGHSVCPVAGCNYEADRPGGLCVGCAGRWREVGGDWDQYVATPMSRQRYRGERLCRVCRTPGHRRPVKSNGLCVACEGARRHRHQRVDAYISGDDRFAPAAPRPTIGDCVSRRADDSPRTAMGCATATGPAGPARVDPNSEGGATRLIRYWAIGVGGSHWRGCPRDSSPGSSSASRSASTRASSAGSPICGR